MHIFKENWHNFFLNCPRNAINDLYKLCLFFGQIILVKSTTKYDSSEM